jgi:hypothetical protein
MRLDKIVLALLLSAAPAFAQGKTPAQGPDSLRQATPAPESPTRVSGQADAWRLRAQLEALRLFGTGAPLPSIEQFSVGNRVIPAGSAVQGPLGVKDGSLDVFGKITGTALVIDGNLRLHPGAEIIGDALAVRGRVINQGGSVTGEARALETLAADGQAKDVGPPHTTMWALKLTLGWFAVLVIIGVGVMIFAEANLDGVVMALERGVGRAFLAGVLGQVAALPALLLLCVALALTILGILLIPFAIVASIIAIAGLITLGFLAVARMSGLPLVRANDLTPRGVSLRAMFIGLVGYLGIWLIAAAFSWHPVIGGIIRVIALIATWVAATAGLGATLLSRAGTKRSGGKSRVPVDDLSWQTPTPVSGVAASRRK